MHQNRLSKSMNFPQEKSIIGIYLIVYGMCACVLVWLLWRYETGELHLLLNGCHRPWLDVLMRAYTVLAEWPLYVLAALACLYRYSWTIYFAMSELLSALIVQVVKFVAKAPRPYVYFLGDGSTASSAQQAAFERVMVDGVHMHWWNSFPSGHTATFFVFFTVLYMLLMARRKAEGRKWMAIAMALICVGLAFLGGYSRVYLSQHFAADVLAGSAIGMLSAMIMWPVQQRLPKTI